MAESTAVKKNNPDIKPVDIGIKELRKINIYPLSMSDQAILTEDLSKITPSIEQVLSVLGNQASRAEIYDDVTVGDDVIIARVKGWWVKNSIRMNINFKEQ